MSSESPTFAEETANNMRKELQSWWEIPSMAQYISLFREAFNLPEIEIEELENGLIDDCIKGPNEWLQNLVIAFLKSIMPGRVNPANWEVQLKKLIKRKWCLSPFAEKENPFEEEKSFQELNLRSKVEVLYCFCLYRLDNNDITELMKSMDAEALRVQKLGFDDAGNTYWYFYGTRLYKEEQPEEKKTWDEEWKEQKRKSLEKKKRGRGRPPKKQTNEKEVEDSSTHDKFMNVSEKSRWSVVCDTLEEWVNFAEKFRNSKSKNEKSLFQIIQENFLPTLHKIYEEKARKLQQKIKELLPVREKIVTRRETRRLRGETGREINYALLNGYDSDEEFTPPNEDYSKVVEKKSRAERLEERNKRASEAENIHYMPSHKRVKNDEEESKDSSESSQNSSSAESSENIECDLMSQMIKLLSSVKLHKDAWPFLHPVNSEEHPAYYEIIKDPVDLSTIESRLYNGKYETVGDLDEDFSQMVTNSKLYNGENSKYTKMAQTLQTLFREEVANLLEMLESVDSSNADSEEANDSQYHSSSNASSPPHAPPVVESKEHKKVKSRRKKRKRGGNMEALDLLAQASNIAVQNSNSNDLLNFSNTYDDQKKCSDFPNLNISSIHSHPSSYIEKYSSNSSKESNSEMDTLYINDRMDNDEKCRSSSPTDSAISSSSETTNYMKNFTHLTNFIEKDSDKNLNILSNSDVTSILQENDSNNHSSADASSFIKSIGPNANSHSIDNILDGYSENFISQLMKQPVCNVNYQGVTQSKNFYEENFPKLDLNLNKKIEKSPTFVGSVVPDNSSFQGSSNLLYSPGSSPDSITTIDASILGISLKPQKKKSNKNSDTSGTDFVRPEKISSDLTQIQETLKNSFKPKHATEIIQTNSTNSEQTVTVPVTSHQSLNFDYMHHGKSFQNHATYSNSNLPLHIPLSYSKTAQQQDKIQTNSSVSDSSKFFEQNACVPVSSYQPLNLGLSNTSNFIPVALNQTHLINSSLHYPKTDQHQANARDCFNPSINKQTVSSYQPNLNFTYSNSTVPTTFISTFTNSSMPTTFIPTFTNSSIPTTFIPNFGANSNSNLPLHIPASYPKIIEQQTPKSSNNSIGLSMPKSYNHLILDSEIGKGSAVTYHMYSQNKSNQNSEEHLNYMNNASAAAFLMAPNSDKRISQNNIVNNPSSSQKKSPAPQEVRSAPYHVPSTNMPCNTTSPSNPSTNKISSPVTSSSFIPVNSSPQGVKRNKPVIVRASASNIEKQTSVENVAPISLNAASNKTCNNNMQQTNVSQSFSPKTVVVTPSTPKQSNIRVHNPVPTATMQSNVCMPNGLPIVRQVVLPAGTQLPSTGQQFVFTSPQNTIRILSKEQSAQLQNNVGQLNQGYVKVVPQLISQTPRVQSFQIQTLSPNNSTQAFTQIAQNPQFVTVPYMVSNQNSVTDSTSQTNYQTFQMPPRQIHGSS